MLQIDTKSAPNGALSGLSGLRVLVVEDTWHIAKALQSALESVGMVVVGPSATAADADRLVAAQIPHVAVVDVKLKGEMAYGLIDRMHDRGISIVAVSGYPAFPTLTQKASAILEKPFSSADLLATLCQVMHNDNSPAEDLPATGTE
jgi:DNA-binding NtrC family response regulator